jgi:hypothetical protein
VVSTQPLARPRRARTGVVFEVRASFDHTGWLPRGRLALRPDGPPRNTACDQVPTLVLRRPEDPWDAQAGAYLASHIRTARRVDVPGIDEFPWAATPRW